MGPDLHKADIFYEPVAVQKRLDQDNRCPSAQEKPMQILNPAADAQALFYDP